jgi:hypothetical protein
MKGKLQNCIGFQSHGGLCSVSLSVKIVPLIAVVGRHIPMFDMGPQAHEVVCQPVTYPLLIPHVLPLVPTFWSESQVESSQRYGRCANMSLY